MENATTKRCGRCGLDKPRTAFGAHKRSPDGLRPECRECRNAAERARLQSPAGRAARLATVRRYNAKPETKAQVLDYQRTKYATDPAYRAKVQATYRRSRAKHRDKALARDAVNNEVKAGRMPRASSLPCVRCDRQASEYHHHKGYAPEHRLDVIPVCKPCHEHLDHAITLD